MSRPRRSAQSKQSTAAMIPMTLHKNKEWGTFQKKKAKVQTKVLAATDR
jgi:hypothetical protein